MVGKPLKPSFFQVLRAKSDSRARQPTVTVSSNLPSQSMNTSRTEVEDTQLSVGHKRRALRVTLHKS